MKPIHRSIVLACAVLATTGASAVAQDQPPAATASGGNTGLALEFQGRLSILSEFSLTGGGVPRFVPPVAVGLRILDGRLYVGLGLVYDSVRSKGCPGGGGACVTNTDSTLFGVAPIVTYDVLSRGAAHLYPLLSLSFARNDVVAGNDRFAWGANVGVGIRGDLGEAVSIGSEWGWGFLRGTADVPGAATGSVLGHGFWGTINLSARIGL